MKHAKSRRTEDMYYQLVRLAPKGMRDDIMKVYVFVNTVQAHAITASVDMSVFTDLVTKWKRAKKVLSKGTMHEGNSDTDIAVRYIAHVVHRYQCDPKWVDTYLKAIKSDVEGSEFVNAEEQLLFVERTTEMIGRIIAKVAGIKPTYLQVVLVQARAFQLASFMRDSGEDSLNGRLYFPKEDLVTFGLKKLDENEAIKKPAEFREFMEFQATRYRELQKDAHALLRHVPVRVRIALHTARDSNDWIVSSITDNPMVVFEKKLRPNRLRFAYIQASRKINF